MSRTRALLVLGVVVVVLGLTVGGLWWLDRHNGQANTARNAALQAAPGAVVAVLSYDYRRIDQDLQRARAALTGGYRDEFTAEMTKVTVPSARERQTVTRATVLASAVVQAEPGQVLVLVFANQATQSSQSSAVQISAYRLQLIMTLVDDRWLVSRLDQV